MFKRSLTGLNVLVTGGAGFIGSHLVDVALDQNATVTVYDNCSSGNWNNLSKHHRNPKLTMVEADLLDKSSVCAVMRNQDVVWHLGAYSNIASGTQQPELDLRNGLLATINVLEAMRLHEVRQLIFASSGSIYGELEGRASEGSGPLLPISLYAASKLSSEAYVSAYAHLFGIRALIFRFGNIIGSRLNRGAIHDFIRKLSRNSSRLDVLGNGKQAKPYMLVEDCLEAMMHVFEVVKLDSLVPCLPLNVGANTTVSVARVAEIVIETMGLTDVDIRYTGGIRGWPGDQTHIDFSLEGLRQLEWQPRHTAEEAVRIGADRMFKDFSNAE